MKYIILNTEDFQLENGNYQNRCIDCGEVFVGHKRRTVCKRCASHRDDYKPHWKVQIFGEQGSEHWEISVVREDNTHGQKSWGWIDDKKLLVSSDNGPWSICGFVWNQQIALAQELCRKLNAGESIDT